MSPLFQLRIRKFKSNKRAFYSLIIFGFLLFVSLFADFIANDKPIIVVYHGHYYFPVFENYPETTFGGVFETTTDYKDPYVRDLINSNGYMVMPPIQYSYKFSLATEVLAHPTSEHWLGTDDQGRDIVARVVYGFRLSVLYGLLLTFCITVIAITIGAITGYFGGWLDIFMQRLMEIWATLPLILLFIIVFTMIEPSLFIIFIIMLAFGWMGVTDYVRAEFFRARKADFVRAARALGVKETKIIFRHILPNALTSTFAVLPFILTGAITNLSILDFLGYGLRSDYPSLGELSLQGKNNLDAPWLGLTAFFTLSTMLSLLMFIGEGVRDAFDPRKVVL